MPYGHKEPVISSVLSPLSTGGVGKRSSRGALHYNGDRLVYNGDDIVYNGFGYGAASVPWTPDQISLYGWWDASDESTITASAGQVSQLDDKSGFSRHMVQTTAANQMTTGANTINGLNALSSTGTDFLECNGFPIPASGNITLIGVFRIDAVDDNADSIWSMDSTSNDYQLNANDPSQFYGRLTFSGTGNNTQAFSGGPYTGVHLVSLVFNFGVNEARGYVDGADVTGPSGYGTALNSSQNFRIMTNRSSNRQLDGLFAEMIAYEDPDADLRETVVGYLAHKYGVTANLQPSHPYKNSPPTI